MGNKLQNIIYTGSNIVPLLLVGSLVLGFQSKDWKCSWILIAVAITIMTVFYCDFAIVSSKLSTKKINVSGVESKDSWILGYIITYFLPFATMMFKDYNIIILSMVALAWIVTSIFAVFAVPNFLLYLIGYHFYKLETDSTGIKDYLLITKKKRYRKNTDVNAVIRLFEKTLIDVEGDK